jgi:hypothetical protein
MSGDRFEQSTSELQTPLHYNGGIAGVTNDPTAVALCEGCGPIELRQAASKGVSRS